MKLAIGLLSVTSAAVSAGPVADRTVDVEQMARQDCALALRRYDKAQQGCSSWECGEYPSLPAGVCVLRWTDPVERFPPGGPGRMLPRIGRTWLVEIMRSAEEL